MFSGKSTYLKSQLTRYILAQKRCFCITHKKDLRYSTDDVMMTHDQISFPAFRATDLSDVPSPKLEEVDVIGIDEGQFFQDIYEFVKKWRINGKIVIVAGLNGTWEIKPFENMSPLFPMIEKITFLTAVCSLCGKDAPFSKRFGDEKELFIIGEKERYTARCGECFHL
jgi:thymidine kinase